MATSMDGPRHAVKVRGYVVGHVWRVEPGQWAFKHVGAMLVGGFRGTKRRAVEACRDAWSQNSGSLS
jgi:hypothetical protein